MQNTSIPHTTDTRITGAMLGLACGDALGAPLEFKNQADAQAQYGQLTEMVGGGMWAPGEWTDDTGMALCIVEGILADPDDPIEATGQAFLEWRKSAKDVGSTISAALGGFKGSWPEAAAGTPQARRGMAGGNGSLMRTLPVALAYRDRPTMLRVSAQISSITHWDPQAEVCCAIYCLWVASLLDGVAIKEAWHRALALAAESHETHSGTVGPLPLPAGFWERLGAVEALNYSQLQPTGYAGYVVDCLEAAVWCCLHGESLEDTLVKSVNLAGESDTIAAVAGGAAGAYWGEAAVPRRWLDALYRRGDIEKAAADLASLRAHLALYATRGLPPFNYDFVADRVVAGRNPLSAHDVELLARAGVTHFLDLREPQEWAPPKFGADALSAIEAAKLTRLSCAVTDMGAPSDNQLATACAFIEAALVEPDAIVYVHCRAGEERTAAVLIAWYARRHGTGYDEAFAALHGRRSKLKRLSQQEAAVRGWLASQGS